jgi:zinc and cadmium transporter
MSPAALLVVYCAAVVAASLFGGLIPHLVRLTHTRMQTALSLVAGAMLGVGLLHLIPHAFLMIGSIDRTMWFALGGFLLMFFIERAFHFHHHGAPDEAESAEPAGPDHECAHGHHGHAHDQGHAPEQAHDPGHTHEHGPEHGDAHGHRNDHGHAHEHGHVHGHASGHRVSWGAALLGLALHSLLDGVALAAAVAGESAQHGRVGLAGLAVFLVIVLHKPFDSLTLSALMTVGGRTPRLRHWVNGTYALAVPTGVLLFQAGVITLGDGAGNSSMVIGCVLALSGGTFLCIATSDLLPELQFHTHDRFRLSAALLAGLGLAAAIVLIEEGGHDHRAPRPPSGPPAVGNDGRL